MKLSTLKTYFNLGLVSTTLALTTILSQGLAPAQAAHSIEPARVVSQAAAPSSANIYYGVGITWNFDNPPTVSSLVEGGPAHRAGIQVGDQLQAVDGQNVSNIDDIVSRIRGEEGVLVTLKIFRPTSGETLTFPIVREAINLDTVFWSCTAQPIRGFGKVWQEHPETHQLLGCPFMDFRQNEHATGSAVQTFEHGWMLWLETDTVANVDPIYVFFEDDASFIRFGDQPLTDAHSYAPTEVGFAKVGDRFARIYWEGIGEEGRERLGQAINESRDSAGAFQEFEHGRMFWSNAADTIYVLYETQYDLDGDGQYTWQQSWLSFDDTFEAEQP